MKKRFSEQQIIGFLKEAGAGMPAWKSRTHAD
ncbi:transposase [Pandoraea horticolens]|uniref:Transposase n=1 Tax=Pandoraea horticolens TaxID=2508298 RepID=A0A5E4YSM0_9BURK|nr:transposase [Pandoraea horticolens]